MKPDLTWLPNDTAYKAAMGDASVHIGGKTPSTHFIPNVNFGKFGDEAWINMNAHNVQVTNETHVNVDDKVELTVGNETHKLYTLNEFDLEWEVEFAQKPSNNEYEFKITMGPGVAAYKQIIPQEDLDNGHSYSRPDAEGSYAFYYNKRNNKYKNGKVAHIYRMWIEDAVGTRVWCDMDLVGNILTVTMPQDSLDSMIYPVTLGPTIGYTGAGSLQAALSGRVYYYIDVDTASTDGSGGDVVSINTYVTAVAATGVKLAAVNCNQSTLDPEGLTVIGQGEAIAVGGTGELISIPASGVLLSNTKYQVGIAFENASSNIRYDTGGTSKSIYYYAATYANEMVDSVPTTIAIPSDTALRPGWVVYEAPSPGMAGGGLAGVGGLICRRKKEGGFRR